MISTPNISDRTPLASLQAGRAMAALLVVLYHNALYIFALEKYWGYDPLNNFFEFSHAGVEFFFVLSGFIILHIHWNDLGQRSQWWSFVKKRFVRIYPIYWLVLATVIPVYFLVPSYGHPYHRAPSTILSSIFLIYAHSDLRSEMAVAWTLYHEVLFYAFFALAIFRRRVGVLLLAAWFSASVASFFLTLPRYLDEYLFSPLHLLFAMGMAICWLWRQGRVSMPGTMAMLGIALFFATGMEENYGDSLSQDTLDLLYGLGSALALLGTIMMERQGRLSIPRWLQLMGDASYSIYLTHFTMLSLLAKLFMHVADMLPDLLCYVLLPFLSVLLGIGFHLLVECPLLRRLRRYRASAVPCAPLSSPVKVPHAIP